MSTGVKNTVTDSILNSIDIITEQKIKNAGFDKTISAEILEVVDASIGKYKVKYQDATFFAYSENTSATYRKGTMVQILIPKGDMSGGYKQILGATSRLGTTYLNKKDDEAVYIKNGSGCFKNNEIKVKISELQKENYLLSLTSISKDEIKNYLRNSSSLLFSCDLKTNIDPSIQRKGVYGIKIRLKMDSDVEKKQEVYKEFEFTTDDVIGTPYSLPVWTSQEKAFHLDKGNFEAIDSIEIFAKNFELGNGADGEISFRNINLFGANVLSEEELSGGKVTIATPKGKYFSKNIENIVLEEKTYLNGKLANREEQKYKVFWFIKNASIGKGDDAYQKYGKAGWACLNQKLGGEEWADGPSILNLNIKDYVAAENEFKCVVVTDGQQFESTIKVLNSNANYDFKITSSENIYFTNDIGKTTLSLEVIKPKEGLGNNISFSWKKTNISGDVRDAGEGVFIEVLAAEINIKETFTCSVFDNATKKLLGSASIEVFNEAQTPEYTLTIVNGKQSFKYDLRGYSPTHSANEHQIPIQPLSFEIYDKRGQKVKDEIIKGISKDKIRWMISNVGNDTLIENTFSNKVGNGVVTQDPLKKYYIINSHALDFKIKDRYSYSAGQNQIQLQVDYPKEDGTLYRLTAMTEFLFTKEGSQGTNGTEDGVCWISSDKPFLEIDNLGKIKSLELKGNPPKGEFKILSRKEDSSWFKIEKDNERTYLKLDKIKDSVDLSHVIQYKTINDENKIECTNTIPVVSVFYTKEGKKYKDIWNFKLKPYTGFLNVQYETNGKYPKYDNNKPFEIEGAESEELQIEWGSTDLLDINPSSLNRKRTCTATPKERYDSYSYSQAIWANINKGKVRIATIHIPIYFYINKYFNADINEWDGNGIEIKDDSGIILSPQVGAGKKETLEDANNAFTGIVIGARETYNEKEKQATETGLFGYNKGVQTIFLDAETGKSEFGASGKGQIVIDPSTNKAQIYSGNFYKDSGEEAKEGMLIDLTTPEIRFGSGNFKVDSNGHLIAKGGGEIAGWKINDKAIFSKEGQGEDGGSKDHGEANVGMSSDASRESLKRGDFFAKGNEPKPLAFWAGNDKFMVAHDGTLKASSAIIGGGTDTDAAIYIGYSQGNSAIYSRKKDFNIDVNASKKGQDGFYIGANGIALGAFSVGEKIVSNSFEVDSNGKVKFQSGQIGYDPDGKEYWTIDGKAIKYNDKEGYNSFDVDKGVYIGTDGIGLGQGKFWVDAKGSVVAGDITAYGNGFSIRPLTLDENGKPQFGEACFYAGVDDRGNSCVYTNNIIASGGKIGGWVIEGNSLTNKPYPGATTGIVMDANGIRHANGTWSISSYGTAIFKDVFSSEGKIVARLDPRGGSGGNYINGNYIGGGTINYGSLSSTGEDSAVDKINKAAAAFVNISVGQTNPTLTYFKGAIEAATTVKTTDVILKGTMGVSASLKTTLTALQNQIDALEKRVDKSHG